MLLAIKSVVIIDDEVEVVGKCCSKHIDDEVEEEKKQVQGMKVS